MCSTYKYIIIFGLPWSCELQQTKFKVLALLSSSQLALFACKNEQTGCSRKRWKLSNYLTNCHVLHPQGNVVCELRTLGELSLAAI